MVHVRKNKWYGACDTPRPSKWTQEAASWFITSSTVHHIIIYHHITSLVLLLMSISINTPALGCAPFLHVLYCISRPFPVFPWLFAIYFWSFLVVKSQQLLITCVADIHLHPHFHWWYQFFVWSCRQWDPKFGNLSWHSWFPPSLDAQEGYLTLQNNWRGFVIRLNMTFFSDPVAPHFWFILSSPNTRENSHSPWFQ